MGLQDVRQGRIREGVILLSLKVENVASWGVQLFRRDWCWGNGRDIQPDVYSSGGQLILLSGIVLHFPGNFEGLHWGRRERKGRENIWNFGQERRRIIGGRGVHKGSDWLHLFPGSNLFIIRAVCWINSCWKCWMELRHPGQNKRLRGEISANWKIFQLCV